MPDTGFVIAGTGTNDTSIGTAAWNAPGRITTDDNSYSEILGGSVTSNYLRASNFGFAIPAGATIDGIEARIERKSIFGGPDGLDNSIKLFNASGVAAGNEKSTGAAWPSSTTVTTLGGATDLWGLTPSEADVEDIDWGWAISGTTVDSWLQVDLMEMKVYYTLAGGFIKPVGDNFRLAGGGGLAG
jgi:hypothetical protein